MFMYMYFVYVHFRYDYFGYIHMCYVQNASKNVRNYVHKIIDMLCMLYVIKCWLISCKTNTRLNMCIYLFVMFFYKIVMIYVYVYRPNIQLYV